MLTIRIKGYAFTISAPFAEGTVLKANEAQALNGLRAENIRNNMAKRIDEALAGLLPGQVLGPEALAELQRAVASYDSAYQFPYKHQPRLRRGDLEAEAQAIAEERVTARAKREGTELSSDELEARIAAEALTPSVLEEARQRVQERRAVISTSLEDLL